MKIKFKVQAKQLSHFQRITSEVKHSLNRFKECEKSHAVTQKTKKRSFILVISRLIMDLTATLIDLEVLRIK